MAIPLGNSYSAATGKAIYAGLPAPASPTLGGFDSITFVSNADGSPGASENGSVLIVELHGSSGQNDFNGRQYRATVSGYMAFAGQTEFGFSTVYAGAGFVKLRPIDDYNPAAGIKESMHMGFKRSDGTVHLITERRYDAMLAWADANLTMFNLNKRTLTGGSMGGWGTNSYGIRRHSQFAALYPDRPRWSTNNFAGKVALPDWDLNVIDSIDIGPTPLLAPEDGGGIYSDYLNMLAYVSNTANKVRWIGWCCGRNDGYARFADQIAAVAAMRAAKRGFAFAWNDGNHATGSIMSQIFASYPHGTFSRDKGYPLFTDHSLDQDPNVDLVGMINGNLKFRNVTESANGWSCEVTSIASACTVKVEPISDVFLTAVAKQTVTIPAANTWVTVSFTA